MTDSRAIERILEKAEEEFEKAFKMARPSTLLSEPKLTFVDALREQKYEFEKKLLHQKLPVDLTQLVSYSNQKLASYCYGLYSDNALTYFMRINRKKEFQYVLKRKIPITAADKNNYNVIHYCVSFEKMDYLSYLIEGDMDAHFNTSIIALEDVNMENEIKKLEKAPWIQSAWSALDSPNAQNGMTPLHMACQIGNKAIVSYLVHFIKKRESIAGASQIDNSYLAVWDHLEYRDGKGRTPLLIASMTNDKAIFKFLMA